MDAATREHVRRRAADRCEYCRLQQQHSPWPHHIEHIVPRQHGGKDTLDNLALACQECNLRKGPNLSSYDPATGALVRLFDPRRDLWEDNFVLKDALIEGITPTGRATVHLLSMNHGTRFDLRSELVAAGKF